MIHASDILEEDAPYSVESMMEHGAKLGAIKMILCSDHDDNDPIYTPEDVFYVMWSDDIDHCEKFLSRGNFCRTLVINESAMKYKKMVTRGRCLKDAGQKREHGFDSVGKILQKELYVYQPGPIMDESSRLLIEYCCDFLEDYAINLAAEEENNYLGESLYLSMKVTDGILKLKEHFGGICNATDN